MSARKWTYARRMVLKQAKYDAGGIPFDELRQLGTDGYELVAVTEVFVRDTSVGPIHHYDIWLEYIFKKEVL